MWFMSLFPFNRKQTTDHVNEGERFDALERIRKVKPSRQNKRESFKSFEKFYAG